MFRLSGLVLALVVGLAAVGVAHAQTLTTLASFSGSNGDGPQAGLTLSADGSALYGTTYAGGASGDGTVFSIPMSGGSPTVLASFNGSNGESPYGGLTLNGNTLYGTTTGGGVDGDGTVFSIPVSGGNPTVLASFNGSNGQCPYAGLTLSADCSTLYGTTYEGGADNDGTVFAMTVPEPSTIALLLASAACLLGYAWRRRRVRHFVSAVAVLLVLTAGISQAQGVFNMPNGEASLQFVTVGNPGNAADSTGFGSVAYAYAMGEYDVTVGQYCQFLNAVAATDSYGLYNSQMALGVGNQQMPTVGIAQSGNPGSYTYSVSYNSAAWSTYATNYPILYPSALAAAADCPAFDVTWGDAARFANWLQNGQPANLGEATGSTETGAYTLNGATGYPGYMAVTRNANATYFIPSENEWYKAAYYNSSSATYWSYPTQSNTAPSNALSAIGTNNANYNSGSPSNPVFTDPTNLLTPVGAFASCPGPYGTYDMGGDVSQWTEGTLENMCHILRGGAFGAIYPSMASWSREIFGSGYSVGFRVASVPEPSTIALLLASAACLFAFAWRRRRGKIGRLRWSSLPPASRCCQRGVAWLGPRNRSP